MAAYDADEDANTWAPRQCEFVLDPGVRYGPFPEPPELCSEDALPFAYFCADHQEADQ